MSGLQSIKRKSPDDGAGGTGETSGLSSNGSKLSRFLFDCLLLCPELHYCGFDVLTSWTFEGAVIETKFTNFNPRQIHLRCRAFGQSGRAAIGALSSVYSEKVICNSSSYRREYY